MHLDAIMIDSVDNVATAIRQLEKGTEVTCTVGTSSIKTVLLDLIPCGHKFAVKEIEPGCPVIKYGETIGLSTSKILAGAHVHVHNVEGQKGRGDKN